MLYRALFSFRHRLELVHDYYERSELSGVFIGMDFIYIYVVMRGQI